MNTNSSNDSSILVAACTYQRPKNLQLLLDSIAHQKFRLSQKPRLRVLIVDNYGDQASKKVCTTFNDLNPSISIRYVLEKKQGISFARNALLANVPEECGFLAMADDDEVLDEFWLDNLLITQKNSGAAVVRGPVQPDYAEDTPEWVKKGEYFGWPTSKKSIKDGQDIESAATNNVLINWQTVKNLNLKFDSTLALTGGEDVVFFHHIRSAGHRIVYSANAKVYESIPRFRTSLKALIRLSFRYGINRLSKNYLCRDYNNEFTGLLLLIPPQIAKAFKHIVIGIALIFGKLLIGQFKVAKLGPELLRISRGIGLLSGCFGFTYKYYR